MTVVSVPLPDYTVDAEPDHATIGRRVDDAVRDHFLGRRIVARGLSSDDHRGRTVDDLVEIIVTSGSDRDDSDRIGDRYDNVDGHHIDLFGIRRTVTPGMRLFAHLSWGFFHGALAVHGRPVRLDLLTIYDSTQLRAVTHRYHGRAKPKRDGFRFVDPQRAALAVLGVIRLER